MKKKYLILISLIMLLGVLFGCSTKKEQFNDENIIFNVVNTQSTNEFKSYTYSRGNWRVSVTMWDTYDFTEWRKPITRFSNAANNLGYLSQKTGVLRTYNWSISFTKYY